MQIPLSMFCTPPDLGCWSVAAFMYILRVSCCFLITVSYVSKHVLSRASRRVYRYLLNYNLMKWCIAANKSVELPENGQLFWVNFLERYKWIPSDLHCSFVLNCCNYFSSYRASLNSATNEGCTKPQYQCKCIAVFFLCRIVWTSPNLWRQCTCLWYLKTMKLEVGFSHYLMLNWISVNTLRLWLM